MRRVLLLVTVAFGVGAQAASSQSAPPKKLAASLERIFGRDMRVDSVLADTAIVLRVRGWGALLGYAAVRNAMGKDQPITYLVAVDTELVLLDVDILVYREPYGGEIAYEPWRRQFRGKGPGDHLEVGREIRGISGATISVNAVTLGIRRALSDLAGWRKAGVL
jgi:Na+-translocating ferredoxin:NAD+ oxidoreductase RnfG subunit